MNKVVFAICFLLSMKIGFSQSNSLWRGYFSYNQITALTERENQIMCSTENALFSKNLTTNELKTINSIDGLNAETITAVYHSSASNQTFIGNSNGILLVVNADGSILYKNGIFAVLPVSPLLKRINHFNENNGKIYISTDYGITVYDLSTNEFGDTYYLLNNAVPAKIYQTTIVNNEIYAVSQFEGIKKASLSNPNLVDYSQWQTFSFDFLNGLTSLNNTIYGSAYNQLGYYNGPVFTSMQNFGEIIINLKSSNGYLIATSANHVYVYNSNRVQIAHIQPAQFTPEIIRFSCATVIGNQIYVGTAENGLYSTTLNNPTTFLNSTPSGPYKNNFFRIKSSATALWAHYGSFSQYYNPYNPGLGEYPINKFTSENGWKLIPYSSQLGAKALSSIAINPNNENQVFIGSHFSGVLKLDNDVPSFLYNQINTGSNGLESLTDPSAPGYIDVRVNGVAFDKNNNLWMTNAFVAKAIKTFKNDGTWQSYGVANDLANAVEESYAALVIDKNSTKWIPTAHNGLMAFNENLNNKILVLKTDTTGNLPNTDVRCVAVDTKNQLWIGTIKGLRYIPNVDSFLTDDELKSKSIIILEDNLAQELFFDQFISDIVVDGANRKWVAISGSGVYLVSPNGQQTIYHFTKENSPLPSNFVNDIEINGVTGEVFFATEKGLVSFKGTATNPSDDLENVFVYPNPVRPGFEGTIKISGLTNRATVKVTDIEGNLVFETTSEGGTIEWDGTAFGNYKVASGVYMVLISAQDGVETKVKKVMIIR